MSAIVEQSDGYGWTNTGATVGSDKNGKYYQGWTGVTPGTPDEPSSPYIRKTIYVDASTFAPVRIDKIIRVNAVRVTTGTIAAAVSTFDVKIAGLVNDSPQYMDDIAIDQPALAAGDQSNIGDIIAYTDIHIKGYATGKVTIDFYDSTDLPSGTYVELRIYIMDEAGV